MADQTKFWSVSSGTVTRQRVDGSSKQGDGNSKHLYVGRDAAPGSDFDYRSFLKFTADWADVGQIVKMELVVQTVFDGNQIGSTTSPKVLLKMLTGAFVEGNNPDGTFDASDYTAPLATAAHSQTKAMGITETRFDITAIGNAWAPKTVLKSIGGKGDAKPNHGLGLYPASALTKNAWAGASEDYTADTSLRPKIELTYKLGATVPFTPDTPMSPTGAVATLTEFSGPFGDPRPTDILTASDVEVYTNPAINVGQVVSGGSLIWSHHQIEAAGDTFHHLPTDLHITTGIDYKWRARVYDQEGQKSLWSDLVQFSTDNTPPVATILQPEDGQDFDSMDGMFVSVDFSDADGDDWAGVQVQLDSSPPSDSVTALWDTGFVLLGLPTTPPVALDYHGPSLLAGTYYIRARMRDARGAVSDWTDPISIVLNNDFNQEPGNQEHPQFDPQTPWRIVIRDMKSQTVPDVELVQVAHNGATDFDTDLALGISFYEDTTTSGYAASPGRLLYVDKATDNDGGTHMDFGAHVLDTEPALIWRAILDLGSAHSIAAADENTYGTCAVALEYASSPSGPWTEVASAAAWAAGPETGIPGTHRVTFAPASARYWALRYDEGAVTGLHYDPGTAIGTISLFGASGASFDDPPTPGNSMIVWLAGRTVKPALPAGFTNISLVSVRKTGPMRWGRLCYRIVQTGDSGSITTAPGVEATMMEWSGVPLLGINRSIASTNHKTTTAFRAGGNITPTRGVPVVMLGAGVIGQADSPSLAVTPLTGTTEIEDSWNGGAPLSWVGYKSISNPTATYNVGGTINHTAQYGGVTILIGRHAPDRGPNDVVAVLYDAKSVGASRMYNAPGEIHFTLPIDHPQLGELEPKQRHYALEFYTGDGWRETTAGLLWDVDATERDAVFTGLDYLACYNLFVDDRWKQKDPNAAWNKGGSYYTGQTIRTIVIDQLQRAHDKPNSPVNFISIGAIATMNEKPGIYSTFRNTLEFISGLLDSHRAGHGKKTRISVVGNFASGYSVQVVDDPGVDRPDMTMRYGELVQGYRVIMFGKQWASILAAVGRTRDGANVTYTHSSAPGIDPAVWGAIEQVQLFDGAEDLTDLTRRAAQAALVYGKLGHSVGMGLRTGLLLPEFGWQITDSLPVKIVHGAIDTTRFSETGMWTIYGWVWEAADNGAQDLVLSLLPKEDQTGPDENLIPEHDYIPQAEFALLFGTPDPSVDTAMIIADLATGIVYVRNPNGPTDDDSAQDMTVLDDSDDVADP